MRTSFGAAAFALALAHVAAPAADEIRPSRLIAGRVPSIPAMMVGGAEAFFEVSIDFDGHVGAVKTLRDAPPLTGTVTDAVRSWRFTPSQRTIARAAGAKQGPIKMARIGKVFVGAVFRPPALVGPTLGTPPVDAATPDAETPFPVSVQTPGFPARAFGAGVVLVEVNVDVAGGIKEAAVVESAPPFDALALEAARQFHFRPSVVDGTPLHAYAYLLFGFPLPVTGDAAHHLGPFPLRTVQGMDRGQYAREFP